MPPTVDLRQPQFTRFPRSEGGEVVCRGVLRTAVVTAPDDHLIADLVRIWVDVTNAGGAVGFVPPVTVDQVRRHVGPLWEQVRRGVADLVVALRDDQPIGFGFLRLPQGPITAHRGEIVKLQRHPSATGSGVGTAVLAGLEERAVARGISLVSLEVRDGTGREHYYAAHGYGVVGRLPGWVMIDRQPTDLILMTKILDGSPRAEVPVTRTTATGPEMQVRQMQVRRLDPGLPLPNYAHEGDAGLDLFAREDTVIPPGRRTLMPTGIAVAITPGHVGLVHPRSGLAVRHGLSIVNSPGTIDAGYRGELFVPLLNTDLDDPITIKRGDRIAQLLVQRVERMELIEVAELPPAGRGEGGLGSTGR